MGQTLCAEFPRLGSRYNKKTHTDKPAVALILLYKTRKCSVRYLNDKKLPIFEIRSNVISVL